MVSHSSMTDEPRQQRLSKRRNITLIGCCWLVFAASTGLVAVDATTTSLRGHLMHRVLEAAASSSLPVEEQTATTTPQPQQQQAVVVPQPLVTKEMQQQTSPNNKSKSQKQQQYDASKNTLGNEIMQQQKEEEELLSLAREEEKFMPSSTSSSSSIEITETMAAAIVVIGLFAMIVTAWQMSDYPDGFYAALCRWIIRAVGGLLRILTSPCRACLGLSSAARYAGHMPVSTMDYGYKDPSLQTSS